MCQMADNEVEITVLKEASRDSMTSSVAGAMMFSDEKESRAASSDLPQL